MSTSTTPQLSEQQLRREKLVREWFVVSDTQALDRYADYLAEDIEFIFANSEAVRGVQTVVGLGEQMKGALKSAIHDLRFVRHGVDGSMTVEMWVIYTRLDDRQLRLPAAVVFEFDEDDKIAKYRIYVDQDDLYA
jgi:ketosteroid isomerase-like protein